MYGCAPIVLFVYNRPEHTRRTVEALAKNELAAESDLIIFSDGPKDDAGAVKVKAVRDYLRTVRGFKSVVINEKEKNHGLANSIIDGVTEIVNKYGRIIVLEDDMVTSPYFLRYMNDALELYKDEEQVISIHGYMYPVKEQLPETFFLRGADCWGWATWKRGWDLFEPDGRKLLAQLKSCQQKKEFDFNNSYPFHKMLKDQIKGKVNSWAIRWYASAFLHDKLTLYPGKSLVKNIGLDGSGIHIVKDSIEYQTLLSMKRIKIAKQQIMKSSNGLASLENYFLSIKKSFLQRLYEKIIYEYKRLMKLVSMER